MNDYHVREDCRLCAGPIEKVLDLGETALANELESTLEESLAQTKFPLFLSQCKTCGHVQLPVVVRPERLFGPDYPYKSGTNPVFRAHLKEFAATVSGMLEPRAEILEIASNDGTLQREFIELGNLVDGVDPTADAARIGCQSDHRAFFSLEWARDFAAASGDSYYFDCIVALNVFAHVDDLNDFTAGVAALLPEDGLFVFEVGYLPDVIEKGLFDVCYHEHLSYHSLRPLHGFFRRHGMSLVDAHRVDSQGGSIRCFVRKGQHGPSDRLMALTDAEDIDVTTLQDKVYRLRLLVKALFSFKYGETFAGFGAPAKLTTLLGACEYAMKLGNGLPPVIYDDNPAKVGKFTPGTGIPIRPTSELLADNPDYLILFSWNFADEVIPRLRALGYRGKIVVPLPEFRVVE